MTWAVLIVRTLLGLAFTVLGLKYFLLSSPMPELPPNAVAFMTALGPTGYLSTVKGFEVVGGFLLLTGIFAPMGLVLVFPVIVNIFIYDICIMGSPKGAGLPMLIMGVFLIIGYWRYFAPFFGGTKFMPTSEVRTQV